MGACSDPVASEGFAVETRLAASRSATTICPQKSDVRLKNRVPFRRALLRWYDRHHRKLPWRETRDPYRIWLSEIMLQQTRVAAVLDHYRIFLERFPTIEKLAVSSEDAVLAAWSGLGYYRRARMLHKCARQIVEQHAGCFPRNAQALQALPGIGRYTAAAIASIAFAEPIAVVDGNVERVLQRLHGTVLATKLTWHYAESLLDRSRPGDFNQAMMELGATVCLPRDPQCELCPVRKWCVTKGEGQRSEAAARQKKKEIWCSLEFNSTNGNGAPNGKIHLVQRSKKDSLMPGMWELPQLPDPPVPLPTSAPWRTFRHSITVTNYTVHVLRNESPSYALPTAKGKWIAIDRIPHMPITGLTRKILKAGGVI
jgi:A/G-specific adenine glycosylase